jgi:YNFM family putative membrane transporter
LFLGGFATFSLLYSVQPLLPVFAADFHVTPAASSLAISLTTALLAVSIIGAASLAERVGKRRLMTLSLAAASLLMLATAAAPSWTVLLTCRAAAGVALGGVPAVAMAYLAEEIEPAGLGFSMGLYIAGNAFGGMIGRLATGALTEAFGWRWALTAVGITGLLALSGFSALLPASRHQASAETGDRRPNLAAWAAHLKNPALRRLFAIGFLAMGSFVTIYNYAGFHLMAPPFALSQTALGLVFATYLFGIAASALSGSLADRFGRAAVLPICIVIEGAGIGLTLAPSLVPIIAGIALLTVGFFATHTVASAWVGRLATVDKGHAASLYLLSYYLGSSLAGSIGGWFWAEGGWGGVVLFTLAMQVGSLAAALSLRRLTG